MSTFSAIKKFFSRGHRDDTTSTESSNHAPTEPVSGHAAKNAASGWFDWPNKILKPSIDETALRNAIELARQNAPVPVFWLLGKTQSGKTSIVRALTGSTRAEIGQGFRPCTRTAARYDFPSEESALLSFLDTRGLGEVDYDPSEDIAYCAKQAHLLIVVMKAMDHEQSPVLAAARQVRKMHPDWPVIIVQTALHEGYPRCGTPHPEPYPFGTTPFGAGVPHDLTLSLMTQRRMCEDLHARFVAVDLTLPEDGFIPPNYGLEALWEAIEAAAPLGLRRLLNDQMALVNDVYARHAQPHITGYALSSGLLAAVPLPWLGLPLVIAAQAKLFHSIASLYGQSLDWKTLSEIASAAGIGGLAAGMAGRELAKLIPGWGAAISGVSTAALTYALGQTLCFYYNHHQQGQPLTQAVLQGFFRDSLQAARERFHDQLPLRGKAS